MARHDLLLSLSLIRRSGIWKALISIPLTPFPPFILYTDFQKAWQEHGSIRIVKFTPSLFLPGYFQYFLNLTA